MTGWPSASRAATMNWNCSWVPTPTDVNTVIASTPAATAPVRLVNPVITLPPCTPVARGFSPASRRGPGRAKAPPYISGPGTFAAERKQRPQSVFAKEDAQPGEERRRQWHERRIVLADPHVRRDRATQVTGKQYRAEHRGGRNHIENDSGELQ